MAKKKNLQQKLPAHVFLLALAVHPFAILTRAGSLGCSFWFFVKE